MLTELAPPPAEALPIDILANHLRMPSGFAGGQDEGLELYLRAAIASIEGMTGKALLSRRFLWLVTRWRNACSQTVPIAPVNFIASMTPSLIPNPESFTPPKGEHSIR